MRWKKDSQRQLWLIQMKLHLIHHFVHIVKKIFADNMEMLTPRGTGQNQSAAPQPAAQPAAQAAPADAAEDLPF